VIYFIHLKIRKTFLKEQLNKKPDYKSYSFYSPQMSEKCRELINDAKLQEKPCEYFPLIFRSIEKNTG